MTIEVALLVSVVSVSFAIYFGLQNNKRADTKDIEERVKENTRINMKLDETINIGKETKNEISLMREETRSLNDRVTKGEESIKQAHRRIDEIIERFNLVYGGGHHE